MDEFTRYTPEQVLAGIQAFVHEQVDEELEIYPDSSVNDYYEIFRESHECPLMFLAELALYFGFTFSERKWVAWLQLPRSNRLSKEEGKRRWEEWQQVTSRPITVRALAEHIARHAPGVSMQPVTVFGVPCAPAGTFRGLCELPEVDHQRVAPSTPLRQVIRGSRLRRFWQRSEWISQTKLSPLTPTRILPCVGPTIGYFATYATLAFAIGTAIYQASGGGLESCFTVFMGSVLGPLPILFVIDEVVDWLRNPLPEGIHTFGDLASFISEYRQITRSRRQTQS
jgi:hypothetical protein